MFEVTQEIRDKHLKKIHDCMLTGNIDEDKNRLKAMAEIRLNLDSKYTTSLLKVNQIEAGYRMSEDYKNAGKNNDQREAWLQLQLQKEKEWEKLEEYKFYWRAISTVDRFNDRFLALDGKMILDQKTEYITGRH